MLAHPSAARISVCVHAPHSVIACTHVSGVPCLIGPCQLQHRVQLECAVHFHLYMLAHVFSRFVRALIPVMASPRSVTGKLSSVSINNSHAAVLAGPATSASSGCARANRRRCALSCCLIHCFSGCVHGLNRNPHSAVARRCNSFGFVQPVLSCTCICSAIASSARLSCT